MRSRMTLLVLGFIVLISTIGFASSCKAGFSMYYGPCSIGPATFDFNFSSYEESNVDYDILPAITPIDEFPWQVGFSLAGVTIATYPSIYTPGFGFYELHEFFTLDIPPGLRIAGTDALIVGAQTIGNAEFSDVGGFFDSVICPSRTSPCEADVEAEIGSAFDQGQIASISWDSADFLIDLRPIPEPASLPLLGTGLACIGVLVRRYGPHPVSWQILEQDYSQRTCGDAVVIADNL